MFNLNDPFDRLRVLLDELYCEIPPEDPEQCKLFFASLDMMGRVLNREYETRFNN